MKIGMTLLPLIAFTLAFSAPLGLAGDAPGFTLHPQSVMVAIGDTLRLSCLATGTPPVSYIWKRDSTFLTDQTNALLVITNAQPGHSARYRAVASNDDGLAQSNPAEVIVYTNMPCNFPWVWAQTFRGEQTNCDSYLWAMATDDQGAIFLTGDTCATNGDRDWLTLKLDQNGHLVWRDTFGDPSQGDDRALAMAVDDAGNCYVTGYSYSRKEPTRIDPDYLTIKYGPSGQRLWVARYDTGTSETQEARAIAVDSVGNVFITGNRGTLKYDPEATRCGRTAAADCSCPCPAMTAPW